MAEANPASPPVVTPVNSGTAWRRLGAALRRHPTAIAGGVVLLAMVLVAVLAPWLGTATRSRSRR
jgi:hypothetical protein